MSLIFVKVFLFNVSQTAIQLLHARAYVCVCVCVCVYGVCVCVCMYVCVLTRACICACLCIHSYVSMCTRARVSEYVTACALTETAGCWLVARMTDGDREYVTVGFHCHVCIAEIDKGHNCTRTYYGYQPLETCVEGTTCDVSANGSRVCGEYSCQYEGDPNRFPVRRICRRHSTYIYMKT